MASWGVSQLLKCASLSYGLQNTIVLRGNERELPCVAVSCRRDYDNWFLLFRLFRLERGAIPYHKAGTHRRVLYEHLVAYKDRTEAEQRKSRMLWWHKLRNSGWATIELSQYAFDKRAIDCQI
jgi:hypothetical protein